MNKISTLSFIFILFLKSLSAQTLPSVEEVYSILEAKCISCHDHASPAGSLDLEGTGATHNAKAINVASHLVNKNPTNAHALTVKDKIIYPGRPDRSFLFRKINTGFESTIGALHQEEGLTMPSYPNVGELTAIEKEILRQWILFGAKNTGVLFDKALVTDWYENNGLKSFPDGPPPAPAPEEGYQIKMGPFYILPEHEVEYYQKYELTMPQNVEVNRLDMKLSGSSHHLIVYNYNSVQSANQIPHGLRLNSNHSDINLVAAVQEQINLKLPATTAFFWDKNIILDLNSHYINYSLERPYQCEAYINVYTQPSGTAVQQMYATLLVNPNIAIFNNGNTITHTATASQAGADSIYIWGLMGHTHKYGTGYKVWNRLANGQKGDLMYDAACPQGIPNCPSPYYDYKHIPMRYWNPLTPIKFSQGLIHEATWVNNGPNSVFFGATSDDEMMVLIAFFTLNPLVLDADEAQFNDIYTPDVRLFPNPATQLMTFVVKSSKGAHHLRIFNREGKVVQSRQLNGESSFTHDVSSLPAGLYFYNLDGNVGKLVVEK